MEVRKQPALSSSEATSEEPRVPEREQNSIRESEFRRFGKAEKSRCVAEGKQGLEGLGERGSWVKGGVG